MSPAARKSPRTRGPSSYTRLHDHRRSPRTPLDHSGQPGRPRPAAPGGAHRPGHRGQPPHRHRPRHRLPRRRLRGEHHRPPLPPARRLPALGRRQHRRRHGLHPHPPGRPRPAHRHPRRPGRPRGAGPRRRAGRGRCRPPRRPRVQPGHEQSRWVAQRDDRGRPGCPLGRRRPRLHPPGAGLRRSGGLRLARPRRLRAPPWVHRLPHLGPGPGATARGDRLRRRQGRHRRPHPDHLRGAHRRRHHRQHGQSRPRRHRLRHRGGPRGDGRHVPPGALGRARRRRPPHRLAAHR